MYAVSLASGSVVDLYSYIMHNPTLCVCMGTLFLLDRLARS